MRYFNYPTWLTMTSGQFDRLFGGPRREPESQVTQREMDIACSIRAVTEIILSQLIHSVREKYDAVIIDTPVAGNSADAYIIAARAKAGLIVARRNVTRVARIDSLVERMGVARAAIGYPAQRGLTVRNAASLQD